MPVFSEQAILTLLGTVGSAIITAIVTYKVALTNANRDVAVKREEYVDHHMRTILEAYQKEVTELRIDISSLIKENQLLREEVISLKSKIIELESYRYGTTTDFD